MPKITAAAVLFISLIAGITTAQAANIVETAAAAGQFKTLIAAACPSSEHSRQLACFWNGGSGSSGVEGYAA